MRKCITASSLQHGELNLHNHYLHQIEISKQYNIILRIIIFLIAIVNYFSELFTEYFCSLRSVDFSCNDKLRTTNLKRK